MTGVKWADVMNRRSVGLRRAIVYSLLVFAQLIWANGALAGHAEQPAVTQSADGSHVVQLSLKSLGLPIPLKIVGGDVESNVDFSFHTLDVIERLRLKVHYSYSPALNPEVSYLGVSLNGQAVGTLPLPKSAARGASAVIEIDPILLQEWNHLNFHFVAHLDKPLCDDPRNPLTWIQLDHIKTVIEADAVTLPLSNDLSFFPVPFFDKHDTRDLTLPFVLPANPSWETLTAAGVLSSWFGGLADWRKAYFPSYLNEIPAQDAIVLATAQDRIDGIELPSVSEGRATIAMVENPHNPNARLLLVVGRDETALVEAAQALTLGKVPLAGSSQSVPAINLPNRRPFDAPNWLTTERKIRLGEIVPAEQLTARGLFVTPLTMVLRLPPNVYRGETTKIPFDFSFKSSNNGRYLIRLDAFINGQLFQYETFEKVNTAGAMARHRVMLNIPAWKTTGKDTISLKYTFASEDHSVCNTAFVRDEVVIDPGSTLDLTETPRYIEMPALSYLAYNGYPFSKMADLSETVVLLPDNPDRFEIESMLTILGHIGNKTTFPATGLTVASVRDAKNFADKDILVVGAKERIKPLLNEWGNHIQVNVLSGSQPIPYFGSRYLERWTEWTLLSAKLNLAATSNQAMMLFGFESPLRDKRSVVVATAANSVALPEEASVLNTFSLAKDFAGDVVAISEAATYDRVSAYERARKYSMGTLPISEQARKFTHHNPWLAVFIAAVIAIIFGAMAYHKLRRIAQNKQEQGDR
jgi:hypothetical protein